MAEILSKFSLNLLLRTGRSLCSARHLRLPGPLLYCVLLLCPLILRANFPPGSPNFPLGPRFIHNLLPCFHLYSHPEARTFELCYSLVSCWHVPEEGLECLLPLFLIPFFIVKSVCSWNLHTCSRKHCRQFNNPNLQNKFFFTEIRQHLLSISTLLLSGTFPTLWWCEKEHELGCEMEDSPSSSSLKVTVVTWTGLFFKPLFSQLEK